MKRLFLFLTILCSLAALGQTREKKFTFHFDNPETLIPSVERGAEGGDSQIVTGTKFESTDGLVTLSFEKAQPTAAGAYIVTDIESNGLVPYLDVSRFVNIVVEGNEAYVTDIRFTNENDQISGLRLEKTQPTKNGQNIGEFGLERPALKFNRWTDNGDNTVTKVWLLQSSPAATWIHEITVTYLLPRDVLEPVSVQPDLAQTVTSFSSLALTFADDMKVTNDAVFTMTDAQGQSYALTAAANGKVVTLSATAGTITTPGTYTITVAAGSLANGDDFRNTKLTYVVTVVAPVDTFDFASVSPAEGNVDKLEKDGIVLTFPTAVGFVDNTLEVLIKNKNGATVRKATGTISGTNSVKLTFTTAVDLDPATDHDLVKGTHTVEIPEGMVYNMEYSATAADKGVSAGARYNPARTLTYNVGAVAYPADATLAACRAALEKTGVGYPLTTTTAYTNLQNLVNLGEGTDAEFQTALAALYAETNIALPATNKYYRLWAETSNGKKTYLRYTGSAVVLTTDDTQAAAFKATDNADGTTTLATIDGKFWLHLPVAQTAYNTTTANVTATYTAQVNNLTLSKLAIDGVDADKAYGLLSLYGCLGTNNTGTAVNAYALVNGQTMTVATDISEGLKYFTASLTNAFRVEEVADTDLPVPAPDYTLTPDGGSLDRLETLTIAFPSLTNVTADASKITLTSGSKSITATVTPVANTTNSFTLAFAEVGAGTWTLNIAEGAFSYKFVQTPATVPAITATYTVTSGIDFIYDFNNATALSFDEDYWTVGDHPLKAEEVNSMTMYSRDSLISVSNEEHTVELVNYNTNAHVRWGKFVVVDPSTLTSQGGKSAKGAIKLQLDSPIAADGLADGQYTYVINAAAFGDEKYGKYLAGDASVKKEDCHVNTRIAWQLTVNSSEAGKEYLTAAQLEQAKNLLANTGMGYPTTGSSARTKLQAMYDSKLGSADEFNAAVAAFYAETNVVKPTAGTWYRIEAVADGGAKAYLTYDGSTVGITTTESQATAFKAAVSNGAYTFETGDGKYLTLPQSGQDFVAATATNFTVDKLTVGNVAADKTFGKFSLASGTLFARANVQTPALAANAAKVYTTGETSAFFFTVMAAADIPVPTVAVSVGPDAGNFDTMPKVTVTFTYPAKATLADKTKVYLLNTTSNEKVAVESVTPASGDAASFEFAFGDVAPGSYTFTAESGAFTFQFAGQTKTVATVPAVTYGINQPTPDEDVLYLARDLLKLEGLGYPETLSTGRTKLRSLVNGGVGTTAEFREAIDNYLAEENVVMPQGLYYYRIEAVGADGKSAFLTYDGFRVGTTTKVAEATAFRVESISGNTIIFRTADGKWLRQVTADDTNLTLTQNNEVNRLAIRKLKWDGCNLEQVFGKFSLSGAVGSDNTPAYTLIDASNGDILTSASEPLQYFTNTKTNAIVLTRVERADIPVPDVVYTLTPDGKEVLEELAEVKVVFSYPNEVSLNQTWKDNGDVYLLSTGGEKYFAESIGFEGNPNGDTKLIRFSNIPDGDTYTLHVADGTFTFQFAYEDQPANIQAVTYTIKPNKPSAEVLAHAKDVLSHEGLGYPVKDAATRTRLQDLVDSNKGKDSEYEKAIADYLAETDVVMPTEGSWYRVVAVADDDARAYLGYDGHQVGVTKAEAGATAFRVEKNGSTLSLLTGDGRYLSLPAPGADNVADTRASLLLRKLAIAGTDAGLTFGKFSLGSVGGKYALTDVATPAILTPSDAPQGLAADGTSAILLAEVADPAAIPVPAVAYTVTPATGSEVEELTEVTVAFSYPTSLNVAADKIYLQEMETGQKLPAAVTDKGGGTLLLAFTGADGTTGEKSYVLVAEDGALSFDFAGKTHGIGLDGVVYTVLAKHPADEVLAEAVELLACEGVGYPARDSEARKALEQLVFSTVGTDEMFRRAMDAFIASADIELPATGTYYRVSAVGSDGTRAYIQYDGTAATITADAAKATPLKATANADGTTRLQTVDGRYLLLIQNSGSNVADAYDATASDLLLQRFAKSGTASDATFGLLRMSGNVVAADGTATAADALVNVETLRIYTNPNFTTLFFTPTLTNAFRMEEVGAEELEELPVPEVAATVSVKDGATVATLDGLTITFSSYGNVELADRTKLYLQAPDVVAYSPRRNAPAGQRLWPVEVVKGTDQKGNQVFTLQFVNVTEGMWRLVAEKGAFQFSFLGEPADVQELSATFTVTEGARFQVEDLAVDYVERLDLEPFVMDSRLNSLTLVSADGALVPDRDAVVTIVDEQQDVVAGGHFETDTDINAAAIRLVLDQEIAEGTLPAGKYTYVIGEAAYGDEQFGLYLESPETVPMGGCRVNKAWTVTVTVDNQRATAIRTVTVSDDDVVYDLHGNRVKGALKRGQVYIVNGRKTLVK